MQYESTSKHDYQTFLDILSEMVSNNMKQQIQKGADLGARNDATIQSTKQPSTD